MGKIFFLLLLNLFACAAIPAAPAELVAAPAVAGKVADLVEHLVSIQEVDENGVGNFVGSGTAIKVKGKEYILTARHVVDTPGVRYQACSTLAVGSCIDLDLEDVPIVPDTMGAIPHDWWIIKVDELPKKVKPARIAKKCNNLVGSDVTIAAYPFGSFFISQGHIGGYILNEQQRYAYVANIFAAPGSSGGPVFDKRHRLVGIVSSIRVDRGIELPIHYINYYIVFITPMENVTFE